jgi:hypothetical protein
VRRLGKLPQDFSDLLIELCAADTEFLLVGGAHSVGPGHFAKEGDAYRFGIAPLKIELLTKISGVSFDEALQGSKSFELDGRQIPYIGKSALITNKKAAGRHKDLADVEELERLDES